jgi:hypothetical protein
VTSLTADGKESPIMAAGLSRPVKPSINKEGRLKR